MNGKAKQIGLALVFATIVCLSVFTYSLHGNYPIEEAEGKATAEAFLSALQAKDYDEIAALYHPDEEMDTETLRKEFEPDKITRFIDLKRRDRQHSGWEFLQQQREIGQTRLSHLVLCDLYVDR